MTIQSRLPYVVVIGFATVLLALLGAACGGSGTSSKSPTPAPTGTGASTSKVSAAVVADLAPTGKLRVAFHGPPPIAFKDASTGDLGGIGVDLAKALAARLGVPFVGVIYDDPGKALAAVNSGQADIAFLPVTPEVVNALDFTAPYMLVPHTYLAGPGSSIRAIADGDKAGVRIASVGTKDHTAILAAQLKNAQVVKVADEAAGIAALKSGQADAFADARFNLLDLAAGVPGSHVVDDNFLVPGMGVAVAHGHASGLAFLREFTEEAKSSGVVQQLIDKSGKQGLPIAPAVPVSTTTPSAAATAAPTSTPY